MVKIHKGCGGKIKGRVCQKCGYVWSRKAYLLKRNIETPKPEPPKGFDPQEYRQRIRRGDDIYGK